MTVVASTGLQLRRTRPKVLITGFDPFGPHRRNSSQLVLEALALRDRHNWVVELLPTSYCGAQCKLLQLLEQHEPRWTLHLGLAAHTQSLRFEESARNWDASPSVDNDGECRMGQAICAAAPGHYSSGLSMQALQAIAAAEGETISVSSDCGGFVCNHVFFSSSHYLSSSFSNARCGFLHLPNLVPNGSRLTRISQIVAQWLESMFQDA